VPSRPSIESGRDTRLIESGEGASTGVTIINIRTPSLAVVGRKESLGRSDLLNLLITPVCYKIHQLRRRFPTELCRPAKWPRLRTEASLQRLQLYKDDLYFVPGEPHPLHPNHITKFGLIDSRTIHNREALLTLRAEEDNLFLTVWEKQGQGWKERGSAIFVYATYALVDVEILSHKTIRVPVPRESHNVW
jgi:hypothetical protein